MKNSITLTGREISNQLLDIISNRVVILLRGHMFQSRCDIKPAIEILQNDIANLEIEIKRNKEAIKFLSPFKGTK